MRTCSRKAFLVTGTFLVLVGVAVLVTYMPAAAGLGLVLPAAIGWSLWIDRHPGSGQDASASPPLKRYQTQG